MQRKTTGKPFEIVPKEIEPPNLLQWMRYVMIFSGQWIFKEKLPFLLSLLYKLNISWVYLYILEIHCTFPPTAIIWWDCKPNVSEMVNCYFRVVGCLSITIILNSQGRENVIAMIRHYELKDFNYENEKVKEIYLRYSKLMNLILKISISGGIVAVINWYILGIMIDVEVTEECPLIQGLLFQLWYPFDITKHIWFAKIVDVTIVVSVGVFLTYSKLLPMCMLVFVLAHIEMLKEQVRQIDDDTEIMSKRKQLPGFVARLYVLKKVLKRHQNVISMMEKVQSVTAIIVMIFYFTEPVALASYLILIVTLRMKVALPFFVTIIQLYVFSRLATEIIEESRGVSDVIYNETKWKNYNKEERRLLLLMMMRSQRQLSVRAAMLGDTSLSTFTKIIKACYSIQTFYGAVKKE